jgi:hypothetical protein
LRISRFLGVLACLGGTVLAAGCGTEHAGAGGSQPVSLTAAVSRTQDQTARVAATIGTQTQGMTLTYTENGVYDFAHSRGTLSMQNPLNMTEVSLPPTTYIKLPADFTGSGSGSGSGASALPNGKTWIALPDAATGDPAASLLGSPEDGADPAGLLAATPSRSTRPRSPASTPSARRRSRSTSGSTARTSSGRSG